MKVIGSAHLRLLLPAALLAAAAVLSGSAVGDPAVACAAPNDTTPDWDQRFYESCIALGKQPPWDCCIYAGGDWKRDTDGYVRCVRPPGGAGPAGGGAGPAGATPAPPPPPAEVVPRPTAPQPSANATVAPPPAAPPTTSTFAPAPLR